MKLTRAIQVQVLLYKHQMLFLNSSRLQIFFCLTSPEYMSIFTACLKEYMTYVRWPLLH